MVADATGVKLSFSPHLREKVLSIQSASRKQPVDNLCVNSYHYFQNQRDSLHPNTTIIFNELLTSRLLTFDSCRYHNVIVVTSVSISPSAIISIVSIESAPAPFRAPFMANFLNNLL